jgi:hypothetical protein
VTSYPIRRRASWSGVLMAAVAALVLLASPASAHGDEGTMEVVTAEEAGPLEIRAEVGVLYANDDDLATEADVTVTATGPGGETVGPEPVELDHDAVYAATLTVPSAGTWTLAFTSENPAATVETTVDVTGESTTTGAPTTSAPPTTELSPATTAPSTASTDASVTDDTADEDEDSSALPIVIGLLVVLAIAGAAIVAIRNRRTPEETA